MSKTFVISTHAGAKKIQHGLLHTGTSHFICDRNKDGSGNVDETICQLITGLHTQKAYTHTGTSSPQIPMLGEVNMHEQVAKSLVYALAGGSNCMSVRLLGM